MCAEKLEGIDDVLVTVGHPHGEIDVPLRTWMETGPGPRPLVRPIAAKSAKWSCPLSLSVVPLRYRNSKWSRLLIRLGLLRDPWAR